MSDFMNQALLGPLELLGRQVLAVLGAGACTRAARYATPSAPARRTGCWIGAGGPARIGRHAWVRWIRRCGRRPRSGVLIARSGAPG